MALTYMDLIEVDLGKLGTAVSDWKDKVGKLKTAADNAREGMKAKSDKARWAGVNATVTRDFVNKTTKEIADLHTEANSIYHVLDDAHRELVALQRKVKTLKDEAGKKGFTIHDNGDCTVTVSLYIPPGTPPDKEDDSDARQRYADEISASLGRANDIDQSVKLALKLSHGSDPNNAGHSSYDSLNDAQVDRALELAKRGEHMTNGELAEFNRLVKFNGQDKDGEFATEFYKGLGDPKKALEFYGTMALDGTAGDDKSRLALTRDLQKSMGMTLAVATDPDTRTHLPGSWGDEFRKLGAERLNIPRAGLTQPYGYQVLGGLLRYGDYDTRFLKPIAEHVVQMHHTEPNLFALARPSTGGVDLDYGYNPSGRVGAGYDPLTSVLEALGHSPEASKAFFSDDDPTVYNTDGTESKNKDALLGYTYFDELTGKDFHWPTDSLGVVSKAHGVDALGHALEAATLGHAWDDTTPTLARDEHSAKIMEQVVHRYGSDPKFTKEQEILSDSLGRMGAGYIDDLNWGLDENRKGSTFAPTSGADEHARFGQSDTISFLSTIGQHPDAYADVSTAGQVYTTSVLEGQVSADGSISEGPARDATRSGAQIQGILDQARADQLKAEGVAADKEYNEALEKRNGWVEFGTGAAVAAGVAFLPEVAAVGVVATAIPVLTDTGQGMLEQQIGNVIGDWTEAKQQDSSDDVQGQARNIFTAGRENSEAPARNFMANHHIQDNSVFGQDLEDAWTGGYNDGTNREDQQGQLPQTGE
ncbi:DUF6571 family protein [Streptomyces sp. NPDC050997]|uniref:DUF6571 family protein n=1 Tax=Streptomyces sp. NPDC050997 TaxID=3155519 RepID=UPI0034421A38